MSTAERAWHVRNHHRGQGAAQKGTECHGTSCPERRTPLNLLSSKWAGLYLHRKLDGNPPVRMSFFLTQKHILIQHAFIRVNDHHTVEDRWLVRMEAEPSAKKGDQSYHLTGAPWPMFQTARPLLECACQQGSILCSLPIPRPFSQALSGFLGMGNRPSCLCLTRCTDGQAWTFLSMGTRTERCLVSSSKPDLMIRPASLANIPEKLLPAQSSLHWWWNLPLGLANLLGIDRGHQGCPGICLWNWELFSATDEG